MIVGREVVAVYELLPRQGFRPILRPELSWDYFVEDASTETAPHSTPLA